MATGKRYYWIKLKDSFMTSDTVDYLMSLPDGANYVVLYQMLCLKTINTGGRLSRQIGEIIIPFDVEKIQRDCKWFTIDTIRIALGLFKQFGLIYEDIDGTLVMADHDNLVGSESDYTERNRRLANEKAKKLSAGVLNQYRNEYTNQCENGYTDIRDKDIKILDTRDKSLDKIERVNNNNNIDEHDEYNPFGEAKKPPADTLEAYITHSLQRMSGDNLEELISFRDILGEDVVRYAINAATRLGWEKSTCSYVRGILQNYIKQDIRTVADAKAADAKFKQQKGGGKKIETKQAYQQHEYKSSDFEDSFYYDPMKEYGEA